MLTEEGSTNRSPAAPIWAIWRDHCREELRWTKSLSGKNAFLSSLSLGAALCRHMLSLPKTNDTNGCMDALCAECTTMHHDEMMSGRLPRQFSSSHRPSRTEEGTPASFISICSLDFGSASHQQ